MAQMTLLQMTQSILNSMSSDEVNSISDTVESLQVANIIQAKYYDVVARGDLPEQTVLFQLTPSGDPGKPVLMYLPAATSKIDWVKYFDSNPADGASLQSDQFGSFSHDLNLDIVASVAWTTQSSTSNTIGTGSKTFTVASNLPVVVGQGTIATAIPGNVLFGTVTSYSGTTLVINVTSFAGTGTFNSWTITNNVSAPIPGYKYVTMLPLDQFVDMVNRFNPADSNVFTMIFTEGGENFTFYYRNDHQPQYCTTIENHFVIFDSYDFTQDSTLQGAKTMCLGQAVTPFQLTDNFTPDLDDNQFPLLLNEAKSLAFYEIKGQPHALAEQEKKRQWSQVQKNKSVANKPNYFDQLANFGRVPRTGGYSGGSYGAYKWMRQAGP